MAKQLMMIGDDGHVYSIDSDLKKAEKVPQDKQSAAAKKYVADNKHKSGGGTHYFFVAKADFFVASEADFFVASTADFFVS